MRNILKGLLLVTIILLNTAIEIYAVPAKLDPVKYQLPDGTTIEILLKGDEKVRWAETLDGYSILLNKDGFYEYAMLNEKGDMVRSGVRAYNLSQRPSDHKSTLTGIQKKVHYSKSQVSMMKQIWQIKENEASKASKAFPTSGNRKLICILIGYSDLSFSKTQSEFNNLFNQVGYSSGGATGSVKDYYLENSYDQFNLTVDVAGPYTASNTMAYYGTNSPSDDYRVRTLVTEAVNLADPDVDFSDYDNDNSGDVDGLYIIYAGYGEEAGASADAIWAHAWAITPVTKDGVSISRYSCSAELSGNSGSTMTGIGVICHEFGHVLGAPDYYDTDYSTDGQYQGTGDWDMMASGSWNNDGITPAHHNMFTKWYYYNWLTPMTLSSATTISMNNSVENAEAYLINTASTNEYFLLENRQQIGFDSDVPGHGLLIYHVDQNNVDSHDGSNDINATHPQYMYPVAQNNNNSMPSGTTSYGTINSSTCPWNGTGKTEFTDASTPSMKSWSGANTNKPITNISESSGVITFDFMGGAQGNPTAFAAVANGTDQIDLSWTRDASRDVILAYNTSNTFGTPTDGVSYSAGNPITGGGTVIYAGGNESYSHTGLSANTTYYYKIFTKLNSTPDWSDGTTTNATTDCSTISTFPFAEDFSGGSLPSCWSNDDNDGSGQVWEFDNPGGRSFNSSTSGNGFAILDSDNYGNGGTQDADLVSPTFDFSSASTVTLEFEHYFRSYSGSAAELSYSINGGSSWTQIQQWSSSTADAESFSQAIAAVAGESSVKFKWNYQGSWGYYWCVDDVSISVSTSSPDPEPANYPTSFADASATSSSITLTWTDAPSKAPAGYLIKGSTVSYADIAAPVDGTPEADATLVKNVAQGTQTVEFTGLTASTTYYFEIYPYANSGATIDYKTDGTIPTVSVITTSSGYYDGITGTGYTLKTNLYNLIDGHTSRTYTQLWTDMQSTDNDGVYENDNTVLDMYGENPSGADPFNFTWVSGQCGTYSGEGDCYNREHSVPASWFSDASPMYTDLFHLYPTDGYVNNIRGNLPFGEVGTANYTSDNGSLRGSCSYPGYTGTVFEPIDEFKGDFARTYFYMATRYENVIAGWETNTTESDAVLNGTSDQVFENWFLSMLIEWHQNDPVSLKETNRNEAVFGIQGNRNPFIDHPEWVCQIWSGFCGPNIAASPASLTGFTYEEGSGPSASQSFELSGTNLDGSQVTVTAPTNYEVSTDNSSFSSSVNVNYIGSSLSSTTIYVRLKAGLSIATYNGENVTCSDNGSASDVTVSNSGEVTAVGGGGVTTCEDFSSLNEGSYGNYTVGEFYVYNGLCNSTNALSNNAVRLRNASGSYLELEGSDGNGVDGGIGSISFWYRNWDGSPAAVYDVSVSIDGGAYSSIGTINTSSTTYDEFTHDINSSSDNIKVKILYSSGERLHIDDFCYTSYSGASTPTLTVSSSSLTGFTYEVGAGPSAEQSFTVEGSDLTDDITLTAPTNYEISTGTGGSFVATSPLTLSESGGSVSETTIYVRLKAGLSQGDYNSEDITVASTGATSETVTCSGNVSNRPDWCNIQSPESGSMFTGGSFNVYARIYEAGLTEPAGEDAGITCWIGYSTDNTDPSTWTDWVEASFNSQFGNDDEYVADIGSGLTAGTYYYASRFSVDGTNYSYGGYSAGGGGFWDGSSFVSGNVTVTVNYPDWCNLQWPQSGSIDLGDAYNVYAQIYEDGVTNGAGQGAGVTAWIGYSTTDTDPSTWTDWVVASYNADDGNNDEYVADLGAAIPAGGTYYYASRFSVNGTDYSYGGFNAGGGDGFWDGTNDVSGELTVTAPTPTIIITEVAGKGFDGDFNDEYIEISNTGSSAVNLTDWTLEYYEGSLEKSLTLSGTLAAGDAYVIAVRTSYNSITPDLVPVSSFSINNNCYVVLKNDVGATMDEAGTSVDKFNDANNYELTDCSADNSVVANWSNLGTGNGTPGVYGCLVTNDNDSEVSASGTLTEPIEISSIVDTEGEKVDVFDFTFTDAGSGDGVATILDELVISQGSANGVGDWTNAIAGAQLDGPDQTAMAGTVAATTITFTLNDMITVADGANETYTLSIWLNSDLSAISDNDILEFALDYNNITVDVSGSSFGSGAPESGDANCAIDIDATELQFVQQPVNTAKDVNMNPSPTVKACDENGNVDVDYATAIAVTSTGTMTGDPVTGSLSNGVAMFTLEHTALGTNLTITASSGALTNAVSNTFDITELSYCSDLMISEYMEGSGNNTAIELFNGTGLTVDLSDYELRQDNSANGSWDHTLSLHGLLPHGEIYLLVDKDGTDLIDSLNAHSITIDSLVDKTQNSTLLFSGDDVVGLFKDDGFKAFNLLDVVGDGSNFQEVNLIRNSNIFAPNTTFTLSEWTEVDPFSFTDLGNTDNPLPVLWYNISATPTNGSILVEWSTHSEINNDYFEVEHSLDNINYNMVGIVDGAGNSSITQEYSYLHSGAIMGHNYYRIKQIDFNGAYDYSKVVTAYLSTDNDTKLNIEYVFVGDEKQEMLISYQKNAKVLIEIYDLTGKVLWSESYVLNDDYAYINLEDFDSNAGVFLISVKDLNQIDSKKFIVK